MKTAILVILCACATQEPCRASGDLEEKARRSADDAVAEQLQIIEAKEQRSKSEVRSAMLRLGQMRAQEAIPALLENIDYAAAPEKETRVIPSLVKSHQESHPAMMALRMMGRPAAVPILEFVISTDDTSKAKLAASVFRDLLGRKEREELVRRKIREGGIRDRKVLRRLELTM